MASNAAVLSATNDFFDKVYSLTEYENKEESDAIFSSLKETLPRVAASQEGVKIIQKFTMLSNTVSAEGPLRDMIKIIWRMVKTMTGSPQYKLCLFFLAIGALLNYLSSSRHADASRRWIEPVQTWLAKQLTIGGKGVTGDGEGTVNDRIQRFFSTPYLHDFD